MDDSLALYIAKHLSPYAFNVRGAKQIETGEIISHPHSTVVAETGGVPRHGLHASVTASPSSHDSEMSSPKS